MRLFGILLRSELTLSSRQYKLFVWTELNMSNIPLPSDTEPHGEISAAATSSEFRIVRGPTLYKKEIVGVAIGTVIGIVLLVGAVAWGVRVWRRRRSAKIAL
jgi:uncharacterized protein (DUF2062 family)